MTQFKAIVPRQLRRAVQRILPTRRYIRYQGSLLPPRQLRTLMCGSPFDDKDYFLESAVAEGRRLIEKLGCNKDTQVVDVGCGVGRLAIGLIHEGCQPKYCGLDAYQPFVRWCQRHVERHHPLFRFLHIDVQNERYNPKGTKLNKNFRFPLADEQADIVYLWGLFTNMAPEDMQIYVGEISRIAKRGASVFLTVFVEQAVPPVSLNPTNYVDCECVGPLNVVRYERDFLFRVFDEHGLSMEQFHHHAGSHNQSEIYLKRRALDSPLRVAPVAFGAATPGSQQELDQLDSVDA